MFIKLHNTASLPWCYHRGIEGNLTKVLCSLGCTWIQRWCFRYIPRIKENGSLEESKPRSWIETVMGQILLQGELSTFRNFIWKSIQVRRGSKSYGPFEEGVGGTISCTQEIWKHFSVESMVTEETKVSLNATPKKFRLMIYVETTKSWLPQGSEKTDNLRTM